MLLIVVVSGYVWLLLLLLFLAVMFVFCVDGVVGVGWCF